MATLPTPVIPYPNEDAKLDHAHAELKRAMAQARAAMDTLAAAVDRVERIQLKKTPTAPRVSAKGAAEGYYRLPGGTFVKVQVNQAGTSSYAKRWVGEAWEYDSSLARCITLSMKLSTEDAHQFGKLYGRCVFCSLQLNDERSITAGYGETCAENHGLPWG